MAEIAAQSVKLLHGRVEDVADLLKLLGNPQRLSIACLLAEGEFAVSQIEERLSVRQPSLSQQLGALREAGLIEGRREAKSVIYRLADDRLRELLGSLHRHFCATDGATAVEPPGPRSPHRVPATAAAVFARIG